MRRILTLALFLLVTAAPAAHAQVYLSWDDCSAAGAHDKSFACDVNTGTNWLYGSFIAPAGTTGITGAEGVIDLAFGGATVPQWWMFGTGNCRPRSLTVVFSVPCASALDYWDSIPGGPLGGWGYTAPNIVADRARLRTVDAIDLTGAQPLVAGSEYSAFVIRIDHAGTTGAGACAGCATPTCLVFTSLRLTQDVGIGDYLFLGNGAAGAWATWQGGAIGGVYGCPGATPTRNETWGHVKSMYR